MRRLQGRLSWTCGERDRCWYFFDAKNVAGAVVSGEVSNGFEGRVSSEVSDGLEGRVSSEVSGRLEGRVSTGCSVVFS